MSDQPVPTERAVDILRAAIDTALPPPQLVDESPERTHAVLSTFARAVPPILDDLAAMAAAEPEGRSPRLFTTFAKRFNHRGTGTVSPSCRWQMQRATLALDRRSTHRRAPGADMMGG